MRIQIADTEKETYRYISALKHLGAEPVNSLGLKEECDALLLPGGTDVNPWRYNQMIDGSVEIDEGLDIAQLALLEKYAKANKPILGICRGIQVINVYFEGSLIQDLPSYFREKKKTGLEHRYLNQKDSLHELVIKPDSFLYPLYGSKGIFNSAHHQAIDKLGKGLIVQAKASDGVIEAVKHVSKPIIGVQFHPERMSFDYPNPDSVDGKEVLAYFVSMIEGQ